LAKVCKDAPWIPQMLQNVPKNNDVEELCAPCIVNLIEHLGTLDITDDDVVQAGACFPCSDFKHLHPEVFGGGITVEISPAEIAVTATNL